MRIWLSAIFTILFIGMTWNSSASAGLVRQDTLRVDVDLVNVLFTVADGSGKFVTSLDEKSFRVFENDKRETITNFSKETDLPLTVVPLDVARRLRVGAPELARLEGALGEHIRRHSQRWLRRSRWLHGPGGFSAFDLLAAATVFAPAAVSSEETTARAHANLWLEFGKGGRPVRLIRGFDGAAILERFRSLINSSLPLFHQ